MVNFRYTAEFHPTLQYSNTPILQHSNTPLLRRLIVGKANNRNPALLPAPRVGPTARREYWDFNIGPQKRFKVTALAKILLVDAERDFVAILTEI
jgi:hypothetical protein